MKIISNPVDSRIKWVTRERAIRERYYMFINAQWMLAIIIYQEKKLKKIELVPYEPAFPLQVITKGNKISISKIHLHSLCSIIHNSQ